MRNLVTQNLELVTERRGLVTGGSYVDTLTLQNAAEDHNLLSTRLQMFINSFVYNYNYRKGQG